MNKIAKYIFCATALLGAFSSCKDENENVAPSFSLDAEEITFNDPNGGTELLGITSDATWQASTEATWLNFAPGNGNGSATVEVKADSSILASLRTAQIQFMVQGVGMKTIKVSQFGYNKEIVLEKDEIELPSSGTLEERYFDVTITANVNFQVELDEVSREWIEYDNDQEFVLDYGERPRTGKVRFTWKNNIEEEERVSFITFSPVQKEGENEAQPVTLKLVQASAPVMEDNRSGDSIAVVAIYQAMNGIFPWDASENMRNWSNVTLWKSTDKIDGEKIPAEMVGRVRSATFMYFDTKESIPYQVRQLRYAESLTFFSNVNRDLRDIELGDDICALMNSEQSYLKYLNLSAYGLTKLPDNFRSDKLEVLDLSSNNFKADGNLSRVITRANFPNLKSLQMNNLRTVSSLKDLKDMNKTDVGYRLHTGFGFTGESDQTVDNNFFRTLLGWDTLESLGLSLSLIEGYLPSDEEVRTQLNLPAYTDEDFEALKDTISVEGKALLIGNQVPKVWPKMKYFSCNLSFLNGPLPSWLLYHPYLDYWNPYSMIYPQEEGGKNTKGDAVGFNGEAPTSMSNYSNLTEALGYAPWIQQNSYYKVYPKKDPNYGIDSSNK